jgi:hypothetical protein
VLVVGRDTIAGDDDERSIPRRIDIAEPIDFAIGNELVMVDGVATGGVTLRLSNRAEARIVEGTHGLLDCELVGLPSRCVLFAQTLGDAVVWFAVLPQRSDETVVLPAIDALGSDSAQLVNGWLVDYAPRLERRCDRDFDSYRQWRAELDDRFNSIYSIEDQRLIAVECLE